MLVPNFTKVCGMSNENDGSRADFYYTLFLGVRVAVKPHRWIHVILKLSIQPLDTSQLFPETYGNQ